MVSRDETGEAGFTLVEMLVALALMGLAAVMMLEGVGSAERLWSGEAARTSGAESVAAAQARLRARIEQLHPATRFDSTNTFVDIDGARDALLFLSTPADAERPAGARRYRLALSGRGDLVLGAASAVAVDASADGGYTDQLLLRDVGGLDISYFGPDPAGGAAHWQTDWTRRAAPPSLVRIRVEMKGGDPRVWPELIVHPAATVDSLCVIDAATGDCRGRA
jgi:general secretion pathway protein J